MQTLLKLLSNALDNPAEEKYKKIRLENTALQTRLLALTGGIAALRFDSVVMLTWVFYGLFDQGAGVQ